MSLRIEWAIDRLTAAVLTAAVSVEKNNTDDYVTAKQNVEQRYEKWLDAIAKPDPKTYD